MFRQYLFKNLGMTTKYYVYELIDPRINKPFYIGKGSGDRRNAHFKEARLPTYKQFNKLKCWVIDDIRKSGCEPTTNIVKKDLQEHQAYQLEIKLISKHGKLVDGTGILTNIRDGGEGGSGQGKSVKCYSKMGDLLFEYGSLEEAAIANSMHKSTICAALNKRTRTAGGYRWSYENESVRDLDVDKTVSPVTQYDLGGNKVKDHSSLMEAADEINVTYTSIVACCIGEHQTSGGFRWSYQGVQLFPLKRSIDFYKTKNYKAIDMITNKTVGVFTSIKNACNETNANPSGIVDCCAGRKNSSGGLYWEYVFV